MDSSLPAVGTVVAEKYRVEALIGEGGMGAVYRARHELMDKPVALKVLLPHFSGHAEIRDRFMQEARAAARIKHPNVVEVFDVGVHQGSLFMVMELLEGETFESVLTQGSMSIPQALALLVGAIGGVADAHERGIIHRDIKPENIFIVRDRRNPDGIAKVLDFGISKLHDEATGVKSITKTGSTMGTPAYMSREHMNGAKEVDLRTDVYSFGVVLYRTLTGVSPFDGENFVDVAIKVATLRPPGPKALRPELPAALDRAVMKAMAYDREDRYPSLTELADALTSLASTHGFLQQMTRPGVVAPKLTPDYLPAGAAAVAREMTVATSTPSTGPRETAPTAQRASPRSYWLAGAALLLTTAFALSWIVWSGTPDPASRVTSPSVPSIPTAQLPRADAPSLALPPLPQREDVEAADLSGRDSRATGAPEPSTDAKSTVQPAAIVDSGELLPVGEALPRVPAPRRGHTSKVPAAKVEDAPAAATSPIAVPPPVVSPPPALPAAETPDRGRRSGRIRTGDF